MVEFDHVSMPPQIIDMLMSSVYMVDGDLALSHLVLNSDHYLTSVTEANEYRNM